MVDGSVFNSCNELNEQHHYITDQAREDGMVNVASAISSFTI